MNTNATTLTGRWRISRFFTKKIPAAVKAAAFVLAALLIVGAPECRAGGADADLSKLQPGMPLPAMRILQEVTPEQRDYLGLHGRFVSMFTGKGFKPSDVDADVLVIEFFNVYCTSCQSQAPILSDVFERVGSQAALRNRVRFFGIGAGNNEKEAAMFTRRYSVGFPMFADPDFLNYEAIGEPGATPLTLIVKKHKKDLLVVSAHAGLVKNADVFMMEIRKALDSTPESLAAQGAANQPAKPDRSARISLNMSDEQIQKKVLESLNKATGGAVVYETVLKQTYPRSGAVYVAPALPGDSSPTLYAQIVSRPPTCDVCHGVHFILVFDSAGIVRYFEPLHLTKYGNVAWSSRDVEYLRGKLVGLDVTEPFKINPTVDSVTTATMTSGIIYNSVKRLQDTLEEIRGK